MSGYREHGFDPSAYEQPGPPLKPYNWVQWTGVALLALSIVVFGYYLASSAGWVPELRVKPPAFGLPLLLMGMSLVYSRREGSTDLAPELAAQRKRWMIITIAVCAIILGAAAIIDLSGA
jgi:hypothetical protein